MHVCTCMLTTPLKNNNIHELKRFTNILHNLFTVSDHSDTLIHSI